MERPQSEQEMAEYVASASVPLALRGGGSQGVVLDGEQVTTSGLRGVQLYEPGALTLVARAGTPVADIESMLAAENQQLAFEPRNLTALLNVAGTPTIGGAFAANLSGPRRIQAGAARDFLLGVRFVDGMGRVVKNGGRVMKNVTGYDLVKLMAGAHGTLGILTEVSMKVLPRQDCTAVVILDGLQPVQAVAAMSTALGSPFDVTGAAHVLPGRDEAATTMIRVEGFEASVAYRTGALQKCLAGFGGSVIETDQGRVLELWTRVRDVAALQGQNEAIWRISVKPGDAPDVLARLRPDHALLDWGGGLIWALVRSEVDARKAMGEIKGHATLVRGRGFARFHPAPAPVAALSAGLRARFDPKGILNPGLMG